MSERFNIDAPLWDQSTFIGRWKHFFWITDPRTGLENEETLRKAKELVEQYRKGQEPPGTTREELIYAKKLFQSAFHPDSGELQNVFGRMSFQVPGGMLIVGGMLTFYRTTSAVILWQWINQSFNALVNYTNRNAQSPLTTTQLGFAYVTATASAMATVIGCKYLGQTPTLRARPRFQRFIPFIAVAAANCVNIPLMRQNEVINGIDVEDENGRKLCKSKTAAVKGISQVVVSRIFRAAPGMLIIPIIMENLERHKLLKQIKPLRGILQTLFVGCFLSFMVPTACGLFPQRCSITTATLARREPAEYEKLLKITGNKDVPLRLYFNKGL